MSVFPRRTGDEDPVASSTASPPEGAHLAPPHPRHEEEPRSPPQGRPRSRATSFGLATAAASAKLVAGGEDGGEVRLPERPRLLLGRDLR